MHDVDDDLPVMHDTLLDFMAKDRKRRARVR